MFLDWFGRCAESKSWLTQSIIGMMLNKKEEFVITTVLEIFDDMRKYLNRRAYRLCHD